MIARERDAGLAAAAADVQHDHRRAENVAGLQELDANARQDLEARAVGMAAHRPDRRRHVLDVVGRLRVAVDAALLLEVEQILGLEMRRVGEQDLGEVPGRGRAVDRTAVAFAQHPRQRAAVVDVGVAQHDGVDRPRVERQLAVGCIRHGARALHEPAVQEDSLPVDSEQVLAAGDVTRSPEELQFDSHGDSLSAAIRASTWRQRFRREPGETPCSGSALCHVMSPHRRIPAPQADSG
jgi:hypothetical protein